MTPEGSWNVAQQATQACLSGLEGLFECPVVLARDRRRALAMQCGGSLLHRSVLSLEARTADLGMGDAKDELAGVTLDAVVLILITGQRAKAYKDLIVKALSDKGAHKQ